MRYAEFKLADFGRQQELAPTAAHNILYILRLQHQSASSPINKRKILYYQVSQKPLCLTMKLFLLVSLMGKRTQRKHKRIKKAVFSQED